MATGHHLAVITNSCVKPPLNPETGLSSTINERPSIALSGTWHGRDDGHDSDTENTRPQNGHLSYTTNGTVLFNKTESILQDVTADLGNLQDEEFYNRLIELKKEHKKTLELCENLYNEKLGMGRSSGTSTQSKYVADKYHIMSKAQPSETLNMSMETMKKSLDTSVDHVKDMSVSKKPPIGKPWPSESRPQKTKGKLNTTGGSTKSRSVKQVWADHSADEDYYWKTLSATSTDFEQSGDEGQLERSLGRKSLKDSLNNSANETRHSALNRIDDMWENFSVDEYAPRTKARPRSSSLSRMSSTSCSSTKDWRHRITIPKPFTMTIRDETKDLTKSRTLDEFERDREEKDRREEEECTKKFKATPVPAHVYMPLYDEVSEKQEAQRRYNRDHCTELLKSQEMPFKFMKREEEKKKHRKSKHEAYMEETDTSKKKEFKARPVPDYLFDDNIDEKICEEEFYRKIRVQMRAEELLRTSSLPPNMAARGEDYFRGKARDKALVEKAIKSGIKTTTSFRPRINDTVPDFDDIHRKFMQKMAVQKGSKEATVCKPFNLRTSRIILEKERIYEDISKDEESLRENRWPFQSTRSRPLTKAYGGESGSVMTTKTKFSTNLKSMRKGKK